MRNAFALYLNCLSVARVPANAGIPHARGKDAKSAQFDTAITSQAFDDRIEEDRNRRLGIA